MTRAMIVVDLGKPTTTTIVAGIGTLEAIRNPAADDNLAAL